jgi:hypothetical protein
MRTAARTDREAEGSRGGAALESLHAKHTVVALVLIGAAAWFGKSAWTSAALGSGMQAVNLFWLERSVQGWLQGAASGQGGVAQRAALRLMALLAGVAAVLFWLPVELVAFTVGISSAVPAVLWHGLAQARRETSR